MSGIGKIPLVGDALNLVSGVPLIGDAANMITGKKKGILKDSGVISQLLAKKPENAPEIPSPADLEFINKKKAARSAASRRGRQSTVQTVIGTPLGGQ